MATIKYFKTRDAARIVAREEGESFQDMGKDAPKGERWAVVFKELADVIAAVKSVEMNVPTESEQKLNAELMAAFAALDIKQAELPKPETIVRTSQTVLTRRDGLKVNVFTKRRVAV
jgi:hypothetical protein